MKAIVIFYSLEGNTKLISNIIADEINADILELKPKKDVTKNKFMKYLWGGKSVFMNEKPELINKIPDLSEYDTIIIGTPIWAGNYAPAINTFINKCEIKNKRIGLFVCHGGGGPGKCFDKIKTAYPKNKFTKTIDFKDPSKQDKRDVGTKIRKWIKEEILNS